MSVAPIIPRAHQASPLHDPIQRATDSVVHVENQHTELGLVHLVHAERFTVKRTPTKK